MKSENKDVLKSLFGELAVQAAFGLIITVLGSIALAYALIGWGVIWLLFPFFALLYWFIKKVLTKIAVERNDAPKSGSRPLP